MAKRTNASTRRRLIIKSMNKQIESMSAQIKGLEAQIKADTIVIEGHLKYVASLDEAELEPNVPFIPVGPQPSRTDGK